MYDKLAKENKKGKEIKLDEHLKKGHAGWVMITTYHPDLNSKELIWTQVKKWVPCQNISDSKSKF